MKWPYLRDEEHFRRLGRAWRTGAPMLVTGAAGTGKTSLARAFAADTGLTPFWLTASPAMSRTPLAALSSAVRVDLADAAPAIVRKLRAAVGDGGILLVEAAEHLDAASATILARYLDQGLGPVLLTQRSTADAALDLVLGEALDRAGAERIAIGELNPSQTAELAGAALAGPVTEAAAVRLHRASGGKPLYLNLLLTGAERAGALVCTRTGTWALDGDLPVSEELALVTTEALRDASPETLRLLTFLSLSSPLSEAVADRLGLSDALPAGPSDSEPVRVVDGQVMPRHAIYTEVVGARLGVLERRRFAAELITALTGGSAPVERLHAARLSVESDLPPDTGLLAEAAATAFLLGDLGLAERLARAAVDAGAGLPGVLQLSRARSAMGDTASAASALAQVDTDSLERDADLAAYAVTAALNHSVGEGDHTAAIGVLDAFEPRIADPDLHGPFEAIRALAHVNAGHQWSALRCSRAATATGSDPVWRSLGCYVEAEALRRLGETRRPRLLATRALEEAGALVGTGARRTLVQVLLAQGDLDGARAEADRLLEATLLQHIPQALAGSTRALVALAAGQFTAAMRASESALEAIGEDDRTGLGRGTAMQLARACAVLGDVAGARRAAEIVQRTTVGTSGWAVFNVLLAEAFWRMAQGETRAPAALARRAADGALAEQQLVDALSALYWGVRLGDRGSAARLVDVAARCEGTLARLQGRHARAWAVRDGGALDAVSAELGRLGLVPYAVDARAQAVLAHRASGRRREAAASAADLAGLRERSEAMTTPAVRAALLDAPLTEREREVYLLTESDVPRAEIAERLGVSAATVAGTLGHAREKLGAQRTGRGSASPR